MSDVTIIDYGVGNLFSVARAIEHCGGTVVFTTEPAKARAAERLILPGVGAFGDGMSALTSSGLADATREFGASGRPLLAICLGMQMLLEESAEFGTHTGLGILPGKVTAIPAINKTGAPHKVPHIGWAGLKPTAEERWAGTPLESSAQGTEVYFVHSFAAEPAEPADLLATYDYGGHEIAAAIGRAGVTGCQFHPERSGPAGLAMIERFLAL